MASKKGKQLTAMERRTKAVEMRIDGASYREIAEVLMVSGTQIHRDVMYALGEMHEELMDKTRELVALELRRLEKPLSRLAKRMQSDDDLEAMEVWRKLSESRRKLLGLDKPIRIAPTNPEGDKPHGELTDVERMAAIAAIFDAARARETGPTHSGDEDAAVDTAECPAGDGVSQQG